MKASDRLRIKNVLSNLVKNFNMQLKINKVPKDDIVYSSMVLADIRKFNTKLAPFKLYPRVCSGGELLDANTVANLVFTEYPTFIAYIDTTYIDAISTTYKGDEINTIFAQQVMNKVASREFKNTFNDYVGNVFMELVEVLEEANISIPDVSKYEYTGKINKDPNWKLLNYDINKRGIDICEFSSNTLIVYIASLYAYYIANRDLVDGLLPSTFDYKIKFKSFLHTFKMITSKLNKFENLNIIHDMLEIDDTVFYGLLSMGLTNIHNSKEDKSAMFKFGGKLNTDAPYGNKTDLSGVYSGDEYPSERMLSPKVLPDTMYSDKGLIAESVMKQNNLSLNSDASTMSKLFIECGVSKVREYFSELMNIRITRTDAEKINYLARKVDRCLILFENMSNVWNKMDAMDFAYDILNEIDEIYLKSTDKNFLLALDSIRKTLTDGMVDCRKKDIKKLRTTINIVYPQGYEG